MRNHWVMAYDEDLADRIRELVGAEANVTEQRMFGLLRSSSAATWPWRRADRAA